MNSLNETKIIESEPESKNNLLKKMQRLVKIIRYLKDDDQIVERFPEYEFIIGEAKITVGTISRDKIKTYTFTNTGVTINEEPCRSQTVDCIKRTT